MVDTFFRPQRLADIQRRRGALRRSEMDQAKHVVAGRGDVGMHAIGGDHHHAGLLEHRRRGAAGGRIAGIDHQLDAVFADQLVGGEDRLVGFGLIVIGDEFQLLPEHAAGSIDVFDRHLRGDLRRLAVGGRRAGQRHLEADLDVGMRRHHGGGAERGRRRRDQEQPGA